MKTNSLFHKQQTLLKQKKTEEHLKKKGNFAKKEQKNLCIVPLEPVY